VIWTHQVALFIRDVDVHDGVAYVIGSFPSIGGAPHARLAALDLATGAPLPFNPLLDGHGFALAVAGETLYISGDFTSVDGQPRQRLAAIDLATSTVTGWTPNWGAQSPCSAPRLATIGSSLVVGCATPRLFDRVSGNVLPWTGAGSLVDMDLAGGRLLTAGMFDASALGAQPGIPIGMLAYPLTVPAASSFVVGTGCGYTPTPVLGASAPVVGEPWNLTLGGPPLAAGGLWLSVSVPATPLDVGSGCFVWLDVGSLLPVATFTTGATGSWSLGMVLPLGIDGIAVRVQGAVVPPGGGFALTNAVDLVAGY
jgi:hypothetical protein